MAVKFLTGKHYPNLCSGCQQMISDTAELLAETGPDTDDEEAPIMYVGDNQMFCGQHTCLDSEYKFQGVRKILDMLKHSESTVAAIKLAHEHNPDRTLEDIGDLVRELKAAYRIEDKAPEKADKENPISVGVRAVETYEIICDWVDRLAAFGKIKEVEEDAITRADIGELNTALLAAFRSTNPHIELVEL